ncbi:MAG: hypothetical protein ACKOJF_03270, partial [Planctomycetaceae bacterium]
FANLQGEVAEAEGRFAEITAHLKESRERLSEADQRQQSVEGALARAKELWRHQTRLLQGQVWKVIGFHRHRQAPPDPGYWDNLLWFRQECQREIEEGLYEEPDNLDLARTLAALL